MRDLSLVKVTKKFGGLTAVSGVELTLDGGKMVSFLGPSGCGKTTLLRLIAGLEVPTKGRIRLGENDITDTPAHRRNIGMVFQSLALFPHLSVGENITYGLRIRGGDSATRARRAEELLELVRLPGVAERHISQLSGGQRQRVAIARALALSPELFLLDEPLSALDANLREAMQIELRQLQQRLGVTTIVVTHDQSEAMTMSDLVVVMSNAEVQQIGPPLEIYRRPANRFVADFIGTSNLLPVRALGNRSVEFAGRTFRVGSDLVGAGAGAEAGGAAVMLARPEDVHVLADRQEGENRIAGSVDFIRDLGATVEIIVDCAGQKVISMMTPKDRPSVEVGGAVTVEFPAAACVLLGA
jgi:putative spermidine/putrescine transport system ATP-binding protein